MLQPGHRDCLSRSSLAGEQNVEHNAVLVHRDPHFTSSPGHLLKQELLPENEKLCENGTGCNYHTPISRGGPQNRDQIPEISKNPLREAEGPCQFNLFFKRITDTSQTLHCFFVDPAF
jgi:hypothetical protein